MVVEVQNLHQEFLEVLVEVEGTHQDLLEVQEILHQHHHHKEIMVEMGKLLLVVEVEVLVEQGLLVQVLKVEMVE